MHSVHVHDVQSAKPAEFNMSHTIHTLSFGTPFPGIVNPLDGMAGATEHGPAMFQFYIKVCWLARCGFGVFVWQDERAAKLLMDRLRQQTSEGV